MHRFLYAGLVVVGFLAILAAGCRGETNTTMPTSTPNISATTPTEVAQGIADTTDTRGDASIPIPWLDIWARLEDVDWRFGTLIEEVRVMQRVITAQTRPECMEFLSPLQELEAGLISDRVEFQTDLYLVEYVATRNEDGEPLDHAEEVQSAAYFTELAVIEEAFLSEMEDEVLSIVYHAGCVPEPDS